MSAAFAADEAFDTVARRSLTRVATIRFLSRPLGVAALIVLVVLFVAGALSHTIAPKNLIDITPGAEHQAPSFAHPFGTDALGRGMVVRTFYAVKATEVIALSAAALATLLGVIVGALAGYFGGWLDALVMRLADLVTAIRPSCSPSARSCIWARRIRTT